MRSEALICAAEIETVHSFFEVNRMIIFHNLCNHQMQIIQFPRLLHTVITEPIKADDKDLRFIKCSASRAIREVHQNRATSALDNI